MHPLNAGKSGPPWRISLNLNWGRLISQATAACIIRGRRCLMVLVRYRRISSSTKPACSNAPASVICPSAQMLLICCLRICISAMNQMTFMLTRNLARYAPFPATPRIFLRTRERFAGLLHRYDVPASRDFGYQSCVLSADGDFLLRMGRLSLFISSDQRTVKAGSSASTIGAAG